MHKKAILIAAFLAIAATAFAQTEADFKVGLTNDNSGAVIIKYTGTAKVVRIPAAIQGFPVREIGEDAFMNNKVITSVIIPDGVAVIQGSSIAGSPRFGAFLGCDKLSQITFPSTLRKIGNCAFWGTALQSIIIPEGVAQIEECAFYSCKALTSVTLPSTIQSIGGAAFNSCYALITVVIPDSVGSVNFSPSLFTHSKNIAFGDCNSLNLASQAALRRRGYTDTFGSYGK